MNEKIDSSVEEPRPVTAEKPEGRLWGIKKVLKSIREAFSRVEDGNSVDTPAQREARLLSQNEISDYMPTEPQAQSPKEDAIPRPGGEEDSEYNYQFDWMDSYPNDVEDIDRLSEWFDRNFQKGLDGLELYYRNGAEYVSDQILAIGEKMGISTEKMNSITNIKYEPSGQNCSSELLSIRVEQLDSMPHEYGNSRVYSIDLMGQQIYTVKTSNEGEITDDSRNEGNLKIALKLLVEKLKE